MRSDCKNKSDRMIAAEVRKLGPLAAGLLERYGFRLVTRDPAYDTWQAPCPRFDEGAPCVFEVHPIMDEDGHPWLACCFNREYRDPSKPWNDDVNDQSFRDIRHVMGDGVNFHCGKFNCHIFERMSAEGAILAFDSHLRRVFGSDSPQGRVLPVEPGTLVSENFLRMTDSEKRAYVEAGTASPDERNLAKSRADLTPTEKARRDVLNAWLPFTL